MSPRVKESRAPETALTATVVVAILVLSVLPMLRLVKEIAIYGGNISRFVTSSVESEVRARVEQIGRKGS